MCTGRTSLVHLSLGSFLEEPEHSFLGALYVKTAQKYGPLLMSVFDLKRLNHRKSKNVKFLTLLPACLFDVLAHAIKLRVELRGKDGMRRVLEAARTVPDHLVWGNSEEHASSHFVR